MCFIQNVPEWHQETYIIRRANSFRKCRSFGLDWGNFFLSFCGMSLEMPCPLHFGKNTNLPGSQVSKYGILEASP